MLSRPDPVQPTGDNLIPASGKTRKGGISLLNHEYYAWREFAQTKECRSDAGR